jgi:hypothetical protein
MFSRRHFLALTSGAFASSFVPELTIRRMPPQLDHIILGCSDLNHGIDFMENLSGYRAAIGGSHSGLGTRNALLALGERRYLEILAPDPQQEKLLWHPDLPQLTEPLIIGWALHRKDLRKYAAYLRETNVACLGPVEGSRVTPDGQVFHWSSLTLQDDRQGLEPFYIDWADDSPHPSTDAPGACLLMEFSYKGVALLGSPPRPNFKKVPIPGRTSQLNAKIAGLYGVFDLVSRSIPVESWSLRPSQ